MNKISEWIRSAQSEFLVRRGKSYVFSDPEVARYSLLSVDPPILHASHWMNEEYEFLYSLERLFDALADRRAYFLYRWCWNIDEPERVRMVKRFELAHRRKYAGHRFVHLCNTRRQHEVFEDIGLEAVFCNHNCLTDEQVYKPMPAVEKRFDAVYDARLKGYKRHDLAAGVKSLALLYAWETEIDNADVASAVKRKFRHAHFFNDTPSGYRVLTAAEVNECLAACRVGLCLSAVEGAMCASAQYLLAGLPIVSTPSLGGRDVFFDDEHVVLVEARAEAVRDAVLEMKRRNLDPERIREKTLAKIRAQRATFMSVVQEIYDREGVDRRFADEWESVFFDTLVAPTRHEETVQRLRAR